MTEEHQALHFTITSPGWQLICKRMGDEQKDYVKQLLDPSVARASRMNDDYIRGYIKGLIFAATWPGQEVKVARETEEAEEKLVNEGGQHGAILEYGYTAGIDYPQEVVSG